MDMYTKARRVRKVWIVSRETNNKYKIAQTSALWIYLRLWCGYLHRKSQSYRKHFWHGYIVTYWWPSIVLWKSSICLLSAQIWTPKAIPGDGQIVVTCDQYNSIRDSVTHSSGNLECNMSATFNIE